MLAKYTHHESQWDYLHESLRWIQLPLGMMMIKVDLRWHVLNIVGTIEVPITKLRGEKKIPSENVFSFVVARRYLKAL